MNARDFNVNYPSLLPMMAPLMTAPLRMASPRSPAPKRGSVDTMATETARTRRTRWKVCILTFLGFVGDKLAK